MYSAVPAGTKVNEFALGQWEGCDLLHGICLSRTRLSTFACHKVVTGSGCGAFHGPLCRHDINRSDRKIGIVSVMYVTLITWWRERRCYVPMPQSWTIAVCQVFVLGSSAENLMSGCTCRLFIPVCTGNGSDMQNPQANIHYRFLLKSEMIGASK